MLLLVSWQRLPQLLHDGQDHIVPKTMQQEALTWQIGMHPDCTHLH